MGGLLPIFKYDSCGYSGDLNDIEVTCFVVLKNNCTNTPGNSNGLAAFLLNLVWDIDAAFQQFFDTINSKIYVRAKINRVWGNWIEIQRIL